MQNPKTDFLAAVFKQDLKKQATFIEFAGWIGLTVFIVLACALWTVKIDITVPAQNVKFVNLAASKDNFVIEAEVLDEYASFVKKGQKVNVKISSSALDEKFDITSTIIEIKQEPDSMNLIIRANPVLDMNILQTLSTKIKNITMRIVINRKNVINLFLEK